jgi:hypothetical protein
MEWCLVMELSSGRRRAVRSNGFQTRFGGFCGGVTKGDVSTCRQAKNYSRFGRM